MKHCTQNALLLVIVLTCSASSVADPALPEEIIPGGFGHAIWDASGWAVVVFTIVCNAVALLAGGLRSAHLLFWACFFVLLPGISRALIFWGLPGSLDLLLFPLISVLACYGAAMAIQALAARADSQEDQQGEPNEIVQEHTPGQQSVEADISSSVASEQSDPIPNRPGKRRLAID